MNAPVRNVSIFDIAAEFHALDDLLEQQEGNATIEDADVVAKWLDALEGAFSSKVENYITYLRNQEVLASGLADESKRLRERAAIHANRVKRLKDALMFVMKLRELDHVETKRGTVAIQGNGGKEACEIFAADDVIPARFFKKVRDDAAVRAALEAGDEEAKRIARFLPKGQHLSIK
jgi:hypothetical protein